MHKYRILFFAGYISLFVALPIWASAQSFPGIPCREGSSIKNVKPEDQAKVCLSSLPVCSELHASLARKVKDMLSWKIYGFYWGKDIDPNQSSFPAPKPGQTIEYKVTKDSLSGRETKMKICSVVGNPSKKLGEEAKLKQDDSTGPFTLNPELTKQTIGLKAECGVEPKFEKTSPGSKSVAVYGAKFDGEKGGLWSAYVLGAYPWVIRKNAYDVLMKPSGGLKPDLSNLNDVLKFATQAAASSGVQVTKILEEISGLESKIQGQERTDFCSATVNLKDKCVNLSVSDPAQRVCSVQAARLLINEGAIASLLVNEILLRSDSADEKEGSSSFKKRFGVLTGNGPVKNFYGACGRVVDGLRGLSSNESINRACSGSCVAGFANANEVNNNWYHATGYNKGKELVKGDDGAYSCHMSSYSKISHDDSSAEIYAKGEFREAGKTRHDFKKWVKCSNGQSDDCDGKDNPNLSRSEYSVNSGFAGLVEAEIRKMCGQTKVSSDSVCDAVGISAMPEYVSE